MPDLVLGKQTFAVATTEPVTSSDLTATRLGTWTEETDDGFIVNGRKRRIVARHLIGRDITG